MMSSYTFSNSTENLNNTTPCSCQLCSKVDVYAIWGTLLTLSVIVYFVILRFIIANLITRDVFTVGYGVTAIITASILALKLRVKLSFLPFYVYIFYLIIRFAAMQNWEDLILISFFQYFIPIAFFFIGYYLWRSGRYKLVVTTLLFTTWFSLLLGQLNYYFGFANFLFENIKGELTKSGDEIVRRSYSLAGLSLTVGILSVIGIMLTLLRPRKQRLVLIPIFLLSLLNSYSRGALIMLFVGLCTLLLLPTHKPRLQKILHKKILHVFILFVVLITLFVASVFLQLSLPQFLKVYFNRFILDIWDPNEEGNSLRFISWNYTINLWQQSPVFGLGFGTIGSAIVVRTGIGLAPESMYLKVLCELGLIGLFLYSLTIFVPLIRAWFHIICNKYNRQHMARVLISLVVAISFGGIYLQNIEYDFFASLFWFLISGLVAFADNSQLKVIKTFSKERTSLYGCINIKLSR